MFLKISSVSFKDVSVVIYKLCQGLLNDFKVFFKGVARIFDVLLKEFHWCSKTVLGKFIWGFKDFQLHSVCMTAIAKRAPIFFCDCVESSKRKISVVLDNYFISEGIFIRVIRECTEKPLVSCDQLLLFSGTAPGGRLNGRGSSPSKGCRD